MTKTFIISVFMSLGGAGVVLAQSGLTMSVLPTGRPSPERNPQDKAAAPSGGADAPPLCTLDGHGIPCAGEPCGGGGNVCGPAGRFWVSGEYLLWWFKDAHLPPLVTTGPANPAQTPPPGAPGAPGTVVLFGGQHLDQDAFSGLRLRAGLWLDDTQTFGVEGSFFFLGSRSHTFTTGSTGAPGSQVLARPFVDTSTGLANSELIAFPGLASGAVAVGSTSRLQGAEAQFLCNLCCSCTTCCDCCQRCGGYRVDLIGGFRYLDLRDGLGVTENTQVLPSSPVLAGSSIRTFDQFDTQNQFYGGQIGARAWWLRDRLFASVTGVVALGFTHQSVDINGATTLTPPGGPVRVIPGGLLALPSNMGSFNRDRFSIVPEVGFTVGYRITNNLSAFAGYNFLYWSNVVRPGDQVSLAVNSTRTPASLLAPNGPAGPLFTFHDSDFWAHGISVGVQLLF